MAIKTKFRGVEYGILVKKKLPGDTLGDCDRPTVKRPVIRLSKRLWDKKKRDKLEVLIHEALHACYFDLDEKAIDEGGRDIARYLKKMGVLMVA